jgi:Concanavalin A-like lectin/glucanases superfamily/Domain of unknown function (DUF1929)
MRSWCLGGLVLLMSAVCLTGEVSAAEAKAGLVAAYGFEDPADSALAGDSSAYGNAGTVVGGATRSAGRFGSALTFDGVDDLVTVPDAGPLNLASGMTLEAWANPTATADWRSLLVKARGDDLSYGLYGSGADSPAGFVFADRETGSARAGDPLPADTWTHVAATYDGESLRLFVNGAQVAVSTTGSGPLTPGNGPLTIGGNGVWDERFAGRIDEVRVYDRALSAAEIQTDMTTPVGAPTADPPGAPRERVGSWTAPEDWPLVAVHASMLSNGKVAVWDAFDAAPGSERIWNPETSTFDSAPSGINLFCSGHVLLPDGRLFVAGGHEKAYVGLRNTMLLDPLATSWTAGPDMSRERWYPTTTTLPDGRVLIVSGDAITEDGPRDTPFVTPSDTLPEIYDPERNTITPLPAASRRMPLYPFMFVAPDGRVVDAGPDTTTRLLDPATGRWSTLASQSPIDGHSAVMYRPGMILKTGTWTDTDFGGVPITNRAAMLDLNQSVPVWRDVARMKWQRTYHTLTVLPDGDVLALGGQSVANANRLLSGPVLQPEIWHPQTNTWNAMASSARPRGYHNVSLLLPDGRVLLAGSGRLDGSTMLNETTAEVFSPPYLFKGPRPTINYAPPSIQYGDTIAVETPDAARIAKVSLVRMGAVTHNFNMDQRWQELSFRRGADRLEVDVPDSSGDAPPGVYYLFVIDDKGVPSQAAIVSFPRPKTTIPPTGGTVPATGGTVPATGVTKRRAGARSALERLSPRPGARRSTAIHSVTATFREAIVAGSLTVHHRRARASIGKARLVRRKTALRAALRRHVAAGTYEAKLRWLTAGGRRGQRTWTFTLR